MARGEEGEVFCIQAINNVSHYPVLFSCIPYTALGLPPSHCAKLQCHPARLAHTARKGRGPRSPSVCAPVPVLTVETPSETQTIKSPPLAQDIGAGHQMEGTQFQKSLSINVPRWKSSVTPRRGSEEGSLSCNELSSGHLGHLLKQVRLSCKPRL